MSQRQCRERERGREREVLYALRAPSDAISRRPLCPRRRQRNNKLIIVVAELRMTARRRRRPFESDAETKSHSHMRAERKARTHLQNPAAAVGDSLTGWIARPQNFGE